MLLTIFARRPDMGAEGSGRKAARPELDTPGSEACRPIEIQLGGPPPGSAAPPSKPDPLIGHRRRLFEALAGHDPKLAAMYLGAVITAEQAEHPERLAQTAHSIRE